MNLSGEPDAVMARQPLLTSDASSRVTHLADLYAVVMIDSVDILTNPFKTWRCLRARRHVPDLLDRMTSDT